jgi:hypothetical protein
MASGDKASLPDDLFTHGGIEGLFASKAAVIEWLGRLGVTWDGDPKTVIQSVAAALRERQERDAARKALEMATMKLAYTNLCEPSELRDIVSALNSVKGAE